MNRYLLAALLIAATGCVAQPQKTMQQLMDEDTAATQKTFAMTPQEQKEVDAQKCPDGKHSVWINTDSKEVIAKATKLPARLCWIDVATLGEVKSEESGPAYGYQIELPSDKEAQQLVEKFQKVEVEAQVRSGWKQSNG